MKISKFLRSKNLLKSLNDERQERKDNGNIDSVSVFGCFAPARWANIPRNNCIADARNDRLDGSDKRHRIATPTFSARNDGQDGFTLVELVITIAIVIILSVISVPIYRGYVDKAKWSEGYALMGTILSAQKAYYSEYGNFLRDRPGTSYEQILGVDARGNKYFSHFFVGGSVWDPKIAFHAAMAIPPELSNPNTKACGILYNVTSGYDWYSYLPLDF